jgi:hypothetical protein
VHVDGDAELGPRLLGEADVVEVRVREHDRVHVRARATDPAERLVEAVPRGRHAGVDHADSAPVLDQVPVRVAVLDAVDARGDVELELHRTAIRTGARSGISGRQ